MTDDDSEVARFSFYIPDKAKYPENTRRGLRVLYRDVEALISWDTKSSALQRLGSSLPEIVERVRAFEANMDRMEEDVRNLDQEILDFFKEDEGEK